MFSGAACKLKLLAYIRVHSRLKKNGREPLMNANKRELIKIIKSCLAVPRAWG
ncbi:unnamed protein product [marine sediment metagenome]|uniref:Uncharacterized protein n=1 Tax=marine sediment metagenome TaxID=412755 RepID=X0Y5E4_9ZZZZ